RSVPVPPCCCLAHLEERPATTSGRASAPIHGFIRARRRGHREPGDSVGCDQATPRATTSLCGSSLLRRPDGEGDGRRAWLLRRHREEPDEQGAVASAEGGEH